MGEQTRRKQNISCFRDANSMSSESVLHVANEETIWKHSESVSFRCFPNAFSLEPLTKRLLKTQNLRLEAKNGFENFQKNFLRPYAILFLQQCFLVYVGLTGGRVGSSSPKVWNSLPYLEQHFCV